MVLAEKTWDKGIGQTKTLYGEKTQIGQTKIDVEKVGEEAREVIGQTQTFHGERTQTKIDEEKVGEEAREVAEGETSSRATKTETCKRGLEDVGCGEGAELVGKEALVEAEKMPVECVGSDARRGDGDAAARGGGVGGGIGGGGWASIHLATSETAKRCDQPSTDVYRRVGCQTAWIEEGIGLEVACLRKEEERLSGGNDDQGYLHIYYILS